MALHSCIFFLVGFVKRIFSARVRVGRSRSSEVIDFGTNRKHVHATSYPQSNLASFQRYCRISAQKMTQLIPVFNPNFEAGAVPVGSPMLRSATQPEAKP